MQEKRKSKRLELTGKIIIKPLSEGSAPESVTISVLDCSRHGLGFMTDRQLVMGNTYEAYLTIWTKEVLHVFMQIVRAVKRDDGYLYGCSFIGMTETDRQRIAVYETVSDMTEGK